VIYGAKKVEQIDDYAYLFIDIYKSNKINIGMNEMTVNEIEMYVKWNNEDRSYTGDISAEIAVNTD